MGRYRNIVGHAVRILLAVLWKYCRPSYKNSKGSVMGIL